MAFRERVKIGLDIGTFSIKYARLSSGKEGEQKLLGFGLSYIYRPSDEGFIEALKELSKEFPERSVNISVSGPSVVVRYVQMPKMSKEELASSMQFEAEKYIPFNIREVMLDYHILEAEVAGKMDVLLVAAKRDIIDKKVNILQEADLSANLIDIDSFALINAFSLGKNAAADEKVKAVINIGEHMTGMNIVSKGRPRFTRDIQIGGRDLTKAISEKMNLDMDAARELKHNPADKTSDIMEICKGIFSNMSDEIRLSLSFYENQSGTSIDEIYLSGGAANHSGLVQCLNENLGLSCQLWDPTGALSISPDIPKEKLDNAKRELAVAIGLALRS